MNKDEVIKELQEKLEKVSKEKEQLEKKVKDLEQQLTFFINPHTPPSKQFFKKRILQTAKKIGAPLGHKGATREIPRLTNTIKYFPWKVFLSFSRARMVGAIFRIMSSSVAKKFSCLRNLSFGKNSSV